MKKNTSPKTKHTIDRVVQKDTNIKNTSQNMGIGISDKSTFEIIFDQSPLSTQIFTPDGILIKVNKAWEKLWGTKLDNIKGYNILKDKQLEELNILPLIKKAFNGSAIDLPPVKYSPNKTIRGVTDVKFRWTKSMIYPIKNRQGKVIRVILQHVDITDSKLKEAELIESEKRFRTLIAKSSDAIQLVDPNGKILFTSESIRNVLGYAPDDLKDVEIAPFIHPDDLGYFSKKVQELLKYPKKHITMQYRVKHKDGSWAWLETSGVNHLKTPSINALVGNFRNITKRKKNFEELQYQKSLLLAQRELSPEGILVVSPEGKMVSYNKRFIQMWKFSKKLMADGEDQQALIDATKRLEYPEKFIKRVNELYKNHQADFEELHFKDGRIFDRYGAPVIGDDGTDYGYVWFFQDITKRKQLERQKDDFISIASHELKTPVTSIKSYAQVLQIKFKKEGNEKAAELMGKMDSQINKLTNLIGDLLDVTKMDTNKVFFRNNYFVFDELISELAEEMQRTTDKHKIILRGQTQKKVFGDRERIGQVITNLVSNAIKYSPDNNKVIIHSSVKNKMINVCVEDFGVGISNDNLNKVFERFFRISGPGKDTFPGLGLGLYISSEIIKRQGGKIWVESTVGKGSSFYFKLPVIAPSQIFIDKNLEMEKKGNS